MKTRENSRLIRWQIGIVLLLFIGYSGYYLCRSNFSVSIPLITDELAAQGMAPGDAKVRLGGIASLGVLLYAVGKFFSGNFADWWGGRRNFLFGMGAAIFFTVAFALSNTLPLFTLAWIGNRMVQSFGWAGMVKIASRWFAFSTYGTVMGFVSLSYLFGDAASRRFMGYLIGEGFEWRQIFYTAAGVLFVLFVLTYFLLKESPEKVGLPEPPASADTLYGEAGMQAEPLTLWQRLKPFLSSYPFWLICILSLGFTLMRETFNTWTPTYFVDAVGLDKEDAANKSALFPLFGGISVLLAGFLSDKIGRTGRAVILVLGCILTTAALLSLSRMDFGGSQLLPVFLVTMTALVMIGPYSYLSGAMALDLGGKQGSATAAGIIDGFGYLGGVLAGDSVARLSVHYGWSGAFLGLAGVAAVSGVAALLFLRENRR